VLIYLISHKSLDCHSLITFSYLSLSLLLTPDFTTRTNYHHSPIPMSSSPEGYAIELYMDPALENQVLKSWNVLARRQISTSLITTASRPHITLFSTTSLLDPLKLEPLLKTLTTTTSPFPLSFSSISSFSNDNNTLFLSPTPSLALLNFHSNLIDSIVKENVVDVGDEFCVGNWIPSCEVAKNVSKGRMTEAFSILREIKLPVNGYAVDVALVSFNPVQEVFSFVLGNHGNNNVVDN